MTPVFLHLLRVLYWWRFVLARCHLFTSRGWTLDLLFGAGVLKKRLSGEVKK